MLDRTMRFISTVRAVVTSMIGICSATLMMRCPQ
jgi:hypothetical protein